MEEICFQKKYKAQKILFEKNMLETNYYLITIVVFRIELFIITTTMFPKILEKKSYCFLQGGSVS